MTEFAPVDTIETFRTLDEGDVLEGYLDGFGGAPEPNSTRSRSYWHGWHNGMIESGRIPPDVVYLNLARAFECAHPVN